MEFYAAETLSTEELMFELAFWQQKKKIPKLISEGQQTASNLDSSAHRSTLEFLNPCGRETIANAYKELLIPASLGPVQWRYLNVTSFATTTDFKS